MTQSTAIDGTDSQKHVRVWFADQAICSYVSEPTRARAYADLMAQRFFGLRVPIDDAPKQSAAKPLPQNSALWPLTVK